MGLKSTTKTGTNTVELEIEVLSDELREAVDKVFRRKVKTITVPGFRKGKAPRQIIERMYGEGVFMEDAVNELYPKAYGDALDESGIEPVDRADIEVLSLDKETGLVFKATVTVKPEVELSGYKGVKAEKTVRTVSDADIDAELQRMRERGARIITVTDRAAKDSDDVLINFEGFVDGEAFDGGYAEGYKLTLGSKSFIDNFEDQITGHSAGDEFDVNVTFPEQYHAEHLKGKPAVFKVKLVEIKERELPALDDEFAKDVSEFDTLAELSADIRKHREENLKRTSDDELENALLDEVIKELKAEIPDVMIENRIDEMTRDFEQRLSSQGMTLKMYLQYAGMEPEAFRESFKEQAERQVKVRLALEKIAELESLEATEDDITAELSKIAEMYNMEIDKVRDVVPQKEVIADIKATKALDFVRDNAVVTEKEPLDEDAKPAKTQPAKKAPAKKAAAAKGEAAKKPEEKSAESGEA